MSRAPRGEVTPGAAARVAAIALAFAACRERQPAAGHGDDHAPADRAADHTTAHGAAGVAPAGAGSAAAPTRILYPGGPGSFVELVRAARPGVVAIRAGAPVKGGPAAMYAGAGEATADPALGTGFLVEARGVFVLTTDHIAAAAAELRVVLADRRELPARVVGRDVRLDLALLAIDEPRLRPLALGDSDGLAVGEWLVVLGNALGDEVTASAGIVAATGRHAAGSLVPGRAMALRSFLQTDARVHRGNSGGPVLDAAGQVVGVAVATADRPGELSFVVPINRVKEILGPLRTTGQVARSWLGVLVQPVDPATAAAAGLTPPTGALVTEVKPSSPAARAGLRPGDIVLTWGDRAVDHAALPWIVAQAPSGRAAAVTIWRGRARVTLDVVPEAMPE